MPLCIRFSWLVVLGTALMIAVGCWRVTAMNMNNISQLTGLPAGLFPLAGVVSGALMAAIAVVRLIRPGSGSASSSEGDIA